MTDFNEINRKLQGRIDPVLLNVIQELYLMMAEVQKQAMYGAKITVDLAKTLDNMADVQLALNDRIKILSRTINPMDWHSESN